MTRLSKNNQHLLSAVYSFKSRNADAKDDPLSTFHIWTIGCQMNSSDARMLTEELETYGYQPSDSKAAADLVVLYSCMVRQHVVMLHRRRQLPPGSIRARPQRGKPPRTASQARHDAGRGALLAPCL